MFLPFYKDEGDTRNLQRDKVPELQVNINKEKQQKINKQK